ncbi:MAG: hypothetical protein WBP12_03075 [Candidatus Saccharimonas sp.]
MRHIHTRHLAKGFTAVEMLVTIIVASTFLLAIITLFIAVTQSLAMTRNRATANDLGYSYLRKYASAGGTPTWFVCDTSNSSSNTNDVTKNSNATGQVLESGTLTASQSNLPVPVSYSVRALAIYGCSGTNLKKPIRVESTVTFGPNSTSIKHSTIVGY